MNRESLWFLPSSHEHAQMKAETIPVAERGKSPGGGMDPLDSEKPWEAMQAREDSFVLRKLREVGSELSCSHSSSLRLQRPAHLL